MKPVNNKSLFTFICDQMELLANHQIEREEASVQANLCREARCLLEYERKRAETEFRLIGSGLKIREIESKAFDDTIPNGNIENQSNKT
jgi:hypothetical protein